MGLIKLHLVIAEPSRQPHIGLGKDDLPLFSNVSRGDDPALNGGS